MKKSVEEGWDKIVVDVVPWEAKWKDGQLL
jgi:hypothetical protein